MTGNEATGRHAGDTPTVRRAPLEGLLVADFSRVLAGPLASMTLADLGARVIKVERPGDGDETRQWGPPYSDDEQTRSTYFDSVNRNKESVCLDLSTPGDLRLARELVERADVVLENFKPGTMAKLGLDYESVRLSNPGVVFLSVTGFGSGGGAGRLGYDFLVQAVGGLMSITGDPQGPPTKVGVALVDVLAAKDAVGAITAALYARERTGSGARLEVNLLSSLQGSLANQGQAYLGAATVPARLGNAHPSIAPYETLGCSDAPLAVACGNDGQFRRLVEVLGAPALTHDERFASNALRVRNRPELVPLLEAALAVKTAEAWEHDLTAAGVPAGRVGSIADGLALADELGLAPTVEVVNAEGLAVGRQVRHPVTWTPALARTNTAPPRLGEHTASVAEWLTASRPTVTPATGEAADPSFDPATGEQRGSVPHSTPAEVDAALHRARAAAAEIADADAGTRLGWLEVAGAAVRDRAVDLVAIAREETGLGDARLAGELQKMTDSARFYGETAVDGAVFEATSESDGGTGSISRWRIPLGPVAVFGASNFPFGFGVFGHDVASALAAGCPVVVKAHPAHPRLSVALAAVVTEALARAGAPHGAFALVVGFDAGLQLVDSPLVKAVGFTGSQRGGMTLVERAAPRGVPVFAEMGTVNPVVVTPDALSDSGSRERIAGEFVASFTLGAGQFCTKPGLIFAPAGFGLVEAIAAAVAEVSPAPLLTSGIAAAFASGIDQLQDSGARPVDTGAVAQTLPGYSSAPRLFAVDLADLSDGSRLLEECFGPVALVAEYRSVDQLVSVLGRLQPSLAASVITGGTDDAIGDRLVPALLPQVGRVTIDAYPTGVLTTASQQHGGPWPATSRPDATSVGAAGLGRWLRPVSVQNATSTELPDSLRAHPVFIRTA